MASQVTDWGASQWMGMLVGIVDIPDNYYIALCAAEPGTGIDGTMLQALEPSNLGSESYARIAIPSGSDDWGVAGNGYVTNLNDVDYGFPDVDWGYLPYFALCSDPLVGDLYAYGEFTSAGTFAASFQVVLPAGAMALRAVSVVPSIVS